MLFFFPLLFLLEVVSLFSFSLLLLNIFELLFKLFEVSYSSLLLLLLLGLVSFSFFKFSLEKTLFTLFKVLSIFCFRFSKLLMFNRGLFDEADDGVLLALLLSVILFNCSLELLILLFSVSIASSFSALDSSSEIFSIFFNLEFTSNC